MIRCFGHPVSNCITINLSEKGGFRKLSMQQFRDYYTTPHSQKNHKKTKNKVKQSQIYLANRVVQEVRVVPGGKQGRVEESARCRTRAEDDQAYPACQGHPVYPGGRGDPRHPADRADRVSSILK